MADHTARDQDRLTGAAAALTEAVDLLEDASAHGRCLFSANNVQKAATLAAGAAVLINSISDLAVGG